MGEVVQEEETARLKTQRQEALRGHSLHGGCGLEKALPLDITAAGAPKGPTLGIEASRTAARCD